MRAGAQKRYIADGFDVTIMDLSALAIDVIRKAIAESSQRAECVAGDLLDPSVCPGPFDVVVERRTLQLFDDTERNRALAALTKRLSSRGLLVTHAHLGGWRPGKPRTHPAEASPRSAGLQSWGPDMPLRGRAALMCVTTG